MTGDWIDRFRKWREEHQDTRMWWRGAILLPFLLARLYFANVSSAIFLTVILLAALLIRARSK